MLRARAKLAAVDFDGWSHALNLAEQPYRVVSHVVNVGRSRERGPVRQAGRVFRLRRLFAERAGRGRPLRRTLAAVRDPDRVRPDNRRHQELRVWAIMSPRRASAPCAVVAVSHREQPFEEVAVTPEGETKVFGGSLFATGPLILEP
jgi:hypothetical protein